MATKQNPPEGYQYDESTHQWQPVPAPDAPSEE